MAFNWQSIEMAPLDGTLIVFIERDGAELLAAGCCHWVAGGEDLEAGWWSDDLLRYVMPQEWISLPAHVDASPD